MHFQSHVADSTLNASQTFLRYVKALPKDRVEWQPSPDSRSALDMFQEIAQDPRDLARLFRGEAIPHAGTDAYFERLRREKAEWTSVDECERVLHFNLNLLLDAMREFPSERLDEKVVEPWGHETTFAELLLYQYWNTTWHTGQVAYIQTLLGDLESY